MSKRNPAFIFLWRRAVLDSGLKATTRHVLLTLSIHMNKTGGGCYPSTKLLEQETGLSERTVCTHLDLGRKAGFISSRIRGADGQDWASHEYQAHIPQPAEPQPTAEHKGTEGDSVPQGEQGTETGSAPLPDQDSKALNLLHEGTEPDAGKALKALKEVQSSMPMSMSESMSLAPGGAGRTENPNSGAPPEGQKGAPQSAEKIQEQGQKKTRAPDLLWEAMLTACGIDPKGKHNDMERGPWNKAVKNLRQAGATPEQVPERAAAYRRKFPSATLTPTALARHWSEVAAVQIQRQRGHVVT